LSDKTFFKVLSLANFMNSSWIYFSSERPLVISSANSVNSGCSSGKMIKELSFRISSSATVRVGKPYTCRSKLLRREIAFVAGWNLKTLPEQTLYSWRRNLYLDKTLRVVLIENLSRNHSC